MGPRTKVIHLFLLASLLAGSASAVAPKLNSISPAGAQRGTEVELKFNGLRLEEAQEVVVYTPGLTVIKLDPSKTNSVKARVRIAPDCRLGEHTLRLRTAYGISDLRTIFVGAYPTVEEVEPNNDPARPQKLGLDVTVAGTIVSEDVDSFQIIAKKGERISAEIEAMRLGRAAFDPFLTLLDADGKAITAVDDSSLLMQDGFISVIAPRDGFYFVQVRETSYGGNDSYAYRLHVGHFPRPTAVYPAGGPAGESLSVKFLGVAGGDFHQTLPLPKAPQDRWGAVAKDQELTAPSPNWMRVSSFPNVLESGSNHDRDHATATDLAPPLALNGIVAAKGEADWFKFKARKGEALEVNVWARRLRSPLDAVLEVFDAKGGSLGANDDAAGADSSVKFTPAAPGDHFVRIKDHLGAGGDDFVYRIEITPAQPSLSLRIPEVARNDSQTRQWIAVPRGNRFGTVISAKRSGFSGDIAFHIDGLPNGVKLKAGPMSGKVDAMPLVFEALPDAPLGGKLLDLVARPTEDGTKVEGYFRNDVDLVQGPNNTSYYGTRVDKIMVAVVKEAPFKVRLAEPKVPLVQAGTHKLKVLAERKAGFDEPITVKMLWNPPGVSGLSEVVIPKGQSTAEYPLNATAEAQTREWQIAVIASATVNGGPLHVSSALTPLEVAPPFVAGKIETLNAEIGKPARIVCKLEQKTPFDGKAKVRLMGLPEKITASEVEITRESKEAAFDLTIDPRISPGSHRALFCSVEIKQQGESIVQSVGSGGVLRVVPPKKTPGSAAKLAKSEVK